MAKPPFTHLHVHTQYSLLDGAARLKDMFNACQEMGMSHIAMTDHGNLHGAYDFFQQATASGVTRSIPVSVSRSRPWRAATPLLPLRGAR